ncbi:MAG: aspartate aminotransferase family protein [Sandaracinaceae bacterium]|nr:aspartate aminotransferase family protein [Sandaracinaceae bacterium]
MPPSIRSPLPGTKSRELIETLAATECPSLTTRRARRAERTGVQHDPIVWANAKGINVLDVDGNVYVDWTAGFGVAVAGHAHPSVVDAIQEQSERAIHALGDVYPSDVKIELLARLAALAPHEDARVILGQSGADAIEAALKTAMLKTKRSGVLAFRGGYHGLSHGPLALCGYSAAFRDPFQAQLHDEVAFAPYPREGVDSLNDAIAQVRAAWSESGFDIGTVVVEPIQARGGIVIPPAGFLKALIELAHERGAVVIADEIYTGLARTGAAFESVRDGALPDILCIGKALGGGMPISACIASYDVMRAWGDPTGEAIHTATFFGHPIACAAALASLDIIDDENLRELAADKGERVKALLRKRLAHHASVREVRGRGMLIGVELDSGERTLRLIRAMLERGHLLLPAGAKAEVLSITPSIKISYARVDELVDALDECLTTS